MTNRPMRYPDLNATKHLRASGREFLGQRLFATEKRDGANIHLWAESNTYPSSKGAVGKPDEDYYVLSGEKRAFHGDDSNKTLYVQVHISSRNMDDASNDLKRMVRATQDFLPYIHMLAENPNFNIFVEYVPPGIGPTRIEPKHKIGRLVLFDVATMTGLDKETMTSKPQFINYTMLYQLATHHKVPIVELLGDGRFPTLEELQAWIDQMLKWCKRHRREGVVIKSYYTEPQVYSKEKVDMPPKPKFSKTVEGGVVLPPLPDSEVNGAINKVFADFGLDFLRDKTKAMPKIAEYVGIEQRKHLCRAPSLPLFQYYSTFLTNLEPVLDADDQRDHTPDECP